MSKQQQHHHQQQQPQPQPPQQMSSILPVYHNQPPSNNNNNNSNNIPSSKQIDSNSNILTAIVSNVTIDERDFDNSFFINEKNDIFIEYSDHFLRARSLRVLCITLIIFLCSLWILTNFDGKEVNFHGAHYYKSSKVAIVAASVMGDNGEEGIQGLEIANHFGGSHHGIHSFYDDDEEDEEDVNFHNLHDHKSESENDITSNNIDSISSINNNKGSDDISSNTKDNNTNEDNLEIEIEKLINESPIVIFSKSYCPYSRRAKHIFSIYDVLPHISVIEVDERDDSEQVKQTLTRLTYQSTFPNIFIDGKSIGGSYELAIMHRSGRLRDILIALDLIDDDDNNHGISSNGKKYNYYNNKKGDFIYQQRRHPPHNHLHQHPYHPQEHPAL